MRPSLPRTTFTLSPATFSISTATSPDSSGGTRTATSADSRATNMLSLPGSESEVLPSAIPATGNSLSFGSPSIFRVRFFSFIARSSRAFTNAPSTIVTAAPSAIAASTTIAATP